MTEQADDDRRNVTDKKVNKLLKQSLNTSNTRDRTEQVKANVQ